MAKKEKVEKQEKQEKQEKTEKKKDFLDTIHLKKVVLQKINAERIPVPDSTENMDLKTDWSYDTNIHEKLLIITAKAAIHFMPEAFMKINAEYEIVFESEVTIKEEVIKENMESLLQPCCSMNTLLVGEITERMMGNPLIVSPFVEL